MKRRYATTRRIATTKPTVLIAYGLRRPARYASPPPPSEPTSPMRIVSQIGIGSGPGTARRASAPVMNADASTPMTVPPLTAAMSTLGGRFLKRVQLAAQVLDLVAQLRRVLEPQLFCGDVHLLL